MAIRHIKAKAVAALSLVVAASMALAGCGNSSTSPAAQGPTTYKSYYTTDPTTYDYIGSNRQSDQFIYSNIEDGLLENDPSGNLIGDLAKSWSVSSDGLTYTYNLRKGINWYKSDGSFYAPIKASDWVTSLEHAVTSKSPMLYLIQPLVKGLDDYVSGKTKDISSVGIKADDKAGTISYTLNAPTPYWNSLMTYNIMFPVNAAFLKTKGSQYGNVSSPSNVLYSGPYLLTSWVAKSVETFKANPGYWDTKNVHIKNVSLSYNSGSQLSISYNQFDKGVWNAAILYPTDPSYKQAQAKYGKNIVYGDPQPTTFNLAFNFNRAAATQKAGTAYPKGYNPDNTHKALLNRDFRAALAFAINRIDYNAQSSGQATAAKAIENTYTLYNLNSAGGKEYGQYIQPEVESLDSSTWGNVDLAPGNNSMYQPDLAKQLLAKAKTELTKEGVTFPVYLDFPQDASYTAGIASAKSLIQSVESTLGTSNVKIPLLTLPEDKFYAATYKCGDISCMDYDMENFTGWGPDYPDPNTYLHTLRVDEGDEIQTLGIAPTSFSDPKAIPSDQASIVKELKLDQYTDLVKQSAAITNDPVARIKAQAKAEALLLNQFVQVPLGTYSVNPRLTKVVPGTGSFGITGIMNSYAQRFKWDQLQSTPVTTAQYNAAKKKFNAAYAKSKTLDEVKQ